MITSFIGFKDAHRREWFRNKTFTTEGKVSLFVDSLKYIETLKPPFFLVVTVEPDLSIRIGRMKSCEQQGRAWMKKILGRDKVCRWCIVAGRWLDEVVDRIMARNKDIISKEGGPGLDKVR